MLQYDVVINYLKGIKQIARYQRDVNLLSQVYGKYGDMFFEMGDYEKSIIYLQRCLRLEILQFSSYDDFLNHPEKASHNLIVNLIRMVEIDIIREYRDELENLEANINYILANGRYFNDPLIIHKGMLLLGDYYLLKNDKRKAKEIFKILIDQPLLLPRIKTEVKLRLNNI